VRAIALFGVIALGALVCAGVGSSIVKRISLTSPIAGGERASLTVNVTPHARCAGRVASKPHAQRLSTKVGGRITWRWTITSDTQAGRWPIVVDCGTSGLLRTTIVVRPAGPELPLVEVAKIICNRIPARVSKRSPHLLAAHARLVPNGLALTVGTSASGPSYTCGFFIEAADGTRPADYSVTITRTARCTYLVRAVVGASSDNSDWSALGETHTETCSSFRG